MNFNKRQLQKEADKYHYIRDTYEKVIRLVDILSYMRQYKIEPKEIRFVCSHNGESPKLVLVKGVKNAKPFLKFRENLYIYDNEGEYTEEIYKIYNKNYVKNLKNDSNMCEKQ